MNELKMSAELAVKKLTRFRWVVMTILFVVYSIICADRANIGIVLPFLRKELAMSNTEAGAIASLFFVGYSVAQIPSGFLYSKLGLRKIFSLAVIATSLFTGLLGTAGSVLTFELYRFGLGLAEAPVPVGAAATINNWFPSKEKGTATGILLSAAKFGPVLVPPICVAIIALAGWRQVFLLFALPGLIMAAVWYIVVKDTPAESPHCSPSEVEYIKTEQTAHQKNVAQNKQYSLAWLDKLIRARRVDAIDTNANIFRSWNILGCALGYFFMVGIVMVLMAWIPTYLINVKKLSVMQMGFVATAPWVGAVLGNLLGGWFSDKVINKRRKPPMLITALSTIFTMYALINSPDNAILLSVMLLVTGILLNLGYSSFTVYTMGLTTKKTYPLAHSVVNTGGQAGGACAPLITGMILDAYNWDVAFMFLAGCSALCLLVLFTIVEPVDDRFSTEPANN